MTSRNAHAAQIDENNVVRQIIVIPFCDDDDQQITEYCNSIGLTGRWIDTSYKGLRRGKYAGIGDIYVENLNIFVSPEITTNE